MNKIAVVGCPGSGKTYFSRELAEQTGLPLIHLDKIYHSKSLPSDPDLKRPLWRKKVKAIVAKDLWITDGNYKGTLDIRLHAADTIIMFDYSRSLVLYRLLKRRYEYRNKTRVDMPIGWEEKISIEFLKFVLNFKRKYRPLLLNHLKILTKGRQVYIFKSPADAQNFLKNI